MNTQIEKAKLVYCDCILDDAHSIKEGQILPLQNVDDFVENIWYHSKKFQMNDCNFKITQVHKYKVIENDVQFGKLKIDNAISYTIVYIRTKKDTKQQHIAIDRIIFKMLK